MSPRNIAMIGAGPAALYATDRLTSRGHHVFILNRDIKPGGLAEFGIYPDKLKMKKGLRKVFDRILRAPQVHYFGNVTVGDHISIPELRELGFDAIVVATGAQGTKWLGLPGEDLDRVYHAKDLVFHYNALPPFSERQFPIGNHACVVGLGNVCLDIVHWLVCEQKISSVTAVARRGPAERAYTEKEMKLVSGALDLEALRAEFDSISDILVEVGQDPDALFAEVTAHKDTPLEVDSPTRFSMRFLRSPLRIEGKNGVATGLTCEATTLKVRNDGSVGMDTLEEYETIPCDTVIFAIGDSIDPEIGLPTNEWGNLFATVPVPWEKHPERERYMVYDPSVNRPVWDTFVIGWARRASDGLVGKARLDAVTGCDEIEAYLEGEFEVGPEDPYPSDEILNQLTARLARKDLVRYPDVLRVLEVEAQIQEEKGLSEFRFHRTEDLLKIILETDR